MGTSFPDIRYMVHVSRESTHKPGVTWCNVVHESDPFIAGMLFHSLVDDLRDRFFKNQVTGFAWQQLANPMSYAVKTAEDMVLFPCLENTKLSGYFDAVQQQERTFVADEKSIREWHFALKQYFIHGPTIKTLAGLFNKNTSVSASLVYAASAALARSTHFQKQVHLFYDHFETILAHSFSTACMRV